MLFTLVVALERGCLEALCLLAFVLALNNISNEAEAVSNGFGTAKTSENLQRFQQLSLQDTKWERAPCLISIRNNERNSFLELLLKV